MNYNSFPPSSGPHFQTPAPWGIYEEPIKQTILVHNLEHGGIVIQYGNVSSGDVRSSRPSTRTIRTGSSSRPTRSSGKFALTAWNTDRYPQDEDLDDDRSRQGLRPHVLEVRRGRLREVPRRAAEQSRRALPERHGHGARDAVAGAAILPPPGWRNWSYAPDLKSGVPSGGVRVRVPPPAYEKAATRLPGFVSFALGAG